jgi:hypothetical protein
MEDSNHLEADSVAGEPSVQRLAPTEGAEKGASHEARGSAAPTPSPASEAFTPSDRAAASPAPDAETVAASDTLDGLETDAPPVWENVDSDADLDAAIADDPWSFLKADGVELPSAEFEPEARYFRGALRAAGCPERALAKYALCADLDQLLGGLLGEQPARETTSGSSPELWRLLRRARTRGESEPRLLSALIRGHLARGLSSALPVICCLIARRLALPSLSARPRKTTVALRLELVRGVCQATRRALASQGEALLRTLPQLAARVGASAATRNLPLSELVPALRRELRRAEQVESAPMQFDDMPQKRSRVRRFRLPGRVEIVIYAK